MKISIYIFLFLSCNILSKAQTQTSPEFVVLEIFKAAQTGEFEKLNSLCDPMNKCDGDVKNICNLINESEDFKTKFKAEFKKGKIKGKPLIKNEFAEVKIIFGSKGNKKETIILVKRENLWYLFSM